MSETISPIRNPKAGPSRWIRPLLVSILVLATIIEIVALSPTQLVENSGSKTVPLEPESLAEDDASSVAIQIPKGRIPEYTIEQFVYVSTEGVTKQWRLLADRAFFYNVEKIVHSKNVQAFLYSPESQANPELATLITGKDAKYYMNKRDLEVFGDVVATFPDGFEIRSEYMRYAPAERKIIVPTSFEVRGNSAPPKDKASAGKQRVHFTSNGLYVYIDKNETVLPQNAHVTLTSVQAKNNTAIRSDRCVIFRDRQFAQFSMHPSRPPEARFVTIAQPRMNAKARRAEMRYGDLPATIHFLDIFEDVLIRDLGNKTSLKYATGGHASFDSKRDVIVLTEFPQVYQDDDTVTGEVILLHRETDIVEIEHSNAFSQGSPPQKGTRE